MGTAAGVAGAAPSVTAEAVVGAVGGLCGGSGASDGGSGARNVFLLADSGRRLNPAHAEAAVGVTVTVASRNKSWSVEAGASVAVYLRTQGALCSTPTRGLLRRPR